MRQRSYIFRRKLRDKPSWRAVLLSLVGYLLIAPPAFAHAPLLAHALRGIFAGF